MNQDEGLLPQGSTRTVGKMGVRNNIKIARWISELVKTTLGPKGMDKMLVDQLGDVTVTNDGATILKELQAEHPAAKIIVEIAKQQEREVGDGTTTVVVIAGELLNQAEILINRGIHPTVIIQGYQEARDHAISILNSIGEEADEESLYNAAKTSMTGKGAQHHREMLAKIVVEAVNKVATSEGAVDKNDIKIECAAGASIDQTTILDGVILKRRIAHPSMNKHLEKAKILLVEEAIQIKKLDSDARIQINNAKDMQGFLKQEGEIIAAMVNKISESGATLLICNKAIDDSALHWLNKEGITAIHRVPREELVLISKATGAELYTKVDQATTKGLGHAEHAHQELIGSTELFIINGCKHSTAASILVRAPTDHIVEEVRRAIEDAVGVVAAIKEDGMIAYGAGHTEARLCLELETFASKRKGREQLAIKAFAQSLEAIPACIAENAGLDPIDIVAELKASVAEPNGHRSGINVAGGLLDAKAKGIIEPIRLKRHAITSATEVATMILRIDDVLAINKAPKAPPSGINV